MARWRRFAPPYYATIALCLALPGLAGLADGSSWSGSSSRMSPSC